MTLLLKGCGRAGASGGPVPIPGNDTPALFQSVNADGWSVTYSAPPTFTPDSSPEEFTVTRAGYDTNGDVTSYSENLVCTKRIRLPYPDQATLTTDQVALSDYIYSTDAVTGKTNNSTEISPKAICQWGVPGRRVVGNSLYLELLAFHRDARNGEQVACVEFIATDGTNTVTAKVSTSNISAQGWDQQPVIVYSTTLDITSLTAGQITVNAKVYPWIGGVASVEDSTGRTETTRGFTPLVFTKNVSKATSPPLVYVSLSGTDATVDVNGVAGGNTKVSTVAATAKANPFLTTASALAALRAATNITGGFTDGCEVRFMAGTHTTYGSVAAVAHTSAAAAIFTRDPDELFTAVTLSFSVAVNFRHNMLVIRDIQMTRTANVFPISMTAVSSIARLQLEGVTFNGAGFTSQINNGAGTIMEYRKCTFDNCGTGPVNAATSEHRYLRGCVFNTNSTVEPWSIVGCRMNSSFVTNAGTRDLDGCITAFNIGHDMYQGAMGVEQVGTQTNSAFVQNVFEWVSSTGNPLFRHSADGAQTNTAHTVTIHNTLVGFYNNGRTNLFYNESDLGILRTQKLHRTAGNIHVSLNTKHDVFTGTNYGHADANLRVGGWSYLYGVGCRSEFTQFADADGGVPGGLSTFSQEYGGLNSNFGTSTTVRNDPLFTDYQAVTSGPTAGSGNGIYSVGLSSPCKNMVKVPVLKWDIAGNSRSATTPTAGAYE